MTQEPSPVIFFLLELCLTSCGIWKDYADMLAILQRASAVAANMPHFRPLQVILKRTSRLFDSRSEATTAASWHAYYKYGPTDEQTENNRARTIAERVLLPPPNHPTVLATNHDGANGTYHVRAILSSKMTAVVIRSFPRITILATVSCRLVVSCQDSEPAGAAYRRPRTPELAFLVHLGG